jgi:hypothetical protein
VEPIIAASQEICRSSRSDKRHNLVSRELLTGRGGGAPAPEMGLSSRVGQPSVTLKRARKAAVEADHSGPFC